MVSFDPYVWAPARYFRQTDSIMLNAPWLNLPILPLEPRGEEFAIEFKDTNNYPDRLRNLFVHSKTASASIAGLPEFVLAEEGPESADPDPLITDLWPQRRCERINWASIVCQVVGVQTGFPVTTAKAISTKRT